MRVIVKPFSKARLKIKLEGNVELYELIQKCEEYFKVGLSFGKTRCYDKSGKLFVEVLNSRFEGVDYEIAITNQDISIYAKNTKSVSEERIVLKIKEFLYALSTIVEYFEYYERIIGTSNVTFTRYYEEGKEILSKNNILLDTEIEMDQAVGLVAKCDCTTNEYLIFKSYYTDTTYISSFFNNTSLCFDMLYDIFEGSDVLAYE